MSLNLADVERQEAHKFLASIGLCVQNNYIWRLPCLPGDFPLTMKETGEVQVLWDAEWDRIKPAVEAQLEIERQAAAVEREAQVKRIEILRTKYGLNEAEREKARVAAANAERQAIEALFAAGAERSERWRERDRERNKLSREYEAKADRQKANSQSTRYHEDIEAETRRQHRNRIRNPNSHGYHPEAVHGFSEHHLYGPRGFKNPFKYEEVPAVWATPDILPKAHYGQSWPLSYRPSHPLIDNKALSIVTADICGDPPKGRSALERRAGLHA